MAGKVTIRDLRRLPLPEPGGATGGILGTHRALDRQRKILGTLEEGKTFIEKQGQVQERKPVAKSDDDAYESYLDEESVPGGLLTPAGTMAGGIFGEGNIIHENAEIVWELRDRQKLLRARGKVLVPLKGDDEDRLRAQIDEGSDHTEAELVAAEHQRARCLADIERQTERTAREAAERRAHVSERRARIGTLIGVLGAVATAAKIVYDLMK